MKGTDCCMMQPKYVLHDTRSHRGITCFCSNCFSLGYRMSFPSSFQYIWWVSLSHTLSFSRKNAQPALCFSLTLWSSNKAQAG